MDNQDLKEQAKEQAKAQLKKEVTKKILSSTFGKWVLIIGIILAFVIFLLLIVVIALENEDSGGSGNGVYDKYVQGQGICNLTSPMKTYTVTSLYGYRVSSGSKFHNGIDLGGNSQGVAVYAAMSGTASVKYTSGYGNYIRIKNNLGEETVYMHLHKATIKSGSYVKQGDKIGEVGNTGASNGVHLDFRFFDSGGKSVSLNNFFGYTDIAECVKNTGNKSEDFRRGCMINSARKMTDLEKEQFKNACAGIGTVIPVEEQPIENPDESEDIDNAEITEE